MTDSVLESITRNSIIQICEFLGIACEERTIDRTELYTCEEAFLCGSAMGITPILSIDKKQINCGSLGKITKQVSECYFDIVSGKKEEFLNWLTSIY